MLLLIIIIIILAAILVASTSQRDAPGNRLQEKTSNNYNLADNRLQEKTNNSHSTPDNKWKQTAKDCQDKMLKLGAKISSLESENIKLIKLRDSIIDVD